MAKVIVLGGCGAVGRVVVKTLAADDTFDEIVIGDLDLDTAKTLAGQIKGKPVSATGVNALEPETVKKAIAGCDLVVNCVGPFYKTVMPIVEAVIESGIHYVDICDDVDVTFDLLDMSPRAEAAGLTMLIGMGNSPGATNLLAKLAADHLLDETEAVDIFHAHGGEPFEGKGVIGHRFHCMSIDIPMFLDGQLQYVKFFEPDGMALRRSFDFPIVGDTMVYPYPHPEQVTLPQYLKVKQVTNRGTILPAAYYQLTMDVCRLGMADKTPIDINGVPVSPYDFATAFLIRERDRILADTGFGTQKGCTSTVVTGKKDGRRQELRFHMASASQALGEGTGIPAALGAILVQQGKVNRRGIFPPEAGVNPLDFVSLIPAVLEKESAGDPSRAAQLTIDIIDDAGKKTTMDMMDAAKMLAS
ncbi:saccharopine dehydrogenase family protein [Desulfosudis oleivorans]|uniref:Saccharopine dehydrogenase n=1 Tax=Desulfosudis oleivorans (strain DSM 6200 / JCM 39069 / Hxd3) TaxID=96561 RepID=A8ZZ06_DESOH|nr:saccharopine dehydrogenase NADP-binding domain-containing protein [Desulfosudis oleivorans]ABW68779.1 Saccharopine dehydrogenase [Desulfosudis oleivorans Hxd3]